MVYFRLTTEFRKVQFFVYVGKKKEHYYIRRWQLWKTDRAAASQVCMDNVFRTRIHEDTDRKASLSFGINRGMAFHIGSKGNVNIKVSQRFVLCHFSNV